jgi:hypothetical protein
LPLIRTEDGINRITVVAITIQTTEGETKHNKATGEKDQMYTVIFTTVQHTRPKNAEIVLETKAED